MPVAGVSSNNVVFRPAAAGAPLAFVAAADTPALDVFEAPKTTTERAIVPRGDRPVLLFNDQCEVCRALSSWVKEKDASGRDVIDERPIGDDPAALKAIDPSLDIWDVYKEIHLVMPDGTIKKGGEAIGEVLRRLPGFGWMGPVLDIELFGGKPFQSALNGAVKVLDAARPAIGCKSCGGGPVVWWSRPIQWVAKAVRYVRGE